MERLTEKHYGKNEYYMKCSESCANDDEMCGGCPQLDRIVVRLAAYEDTGLTPEQVAALKEELQNERYRHDRLQDFEVAEAQELARYRTAEKKGRLEWRPCAIGDTVYEIRCRFVAAHARKRKYDHSTASCSWRIKQQPQNRYVAEKKCTRSDWDHFGKTVFLTHAEAEAKIKEANNNHEG